MPLIVVEQSKQHQHLHSCTALIRYRVIPSEPVIRAHLHNNVDNLGGVRGALRCVHDVGKKDRFYVLNNSCHHVAVIPIGEVSQSFSLKFRVGSSRANWSCL